MSISNSYSTLARVVSHINNPNYQTGTLIEEIPCTLGRSYAGYKRGGVIEGAEKFRKESMSAAVWLFGIPAFNKLGNVFCEKVLNIPTMIDFCKSDEGNNCIKDSVEFLSAGFKDQKEALEKAPLVFGDRFKGVDFSELVKKYGDKFKGANVESLVKKVGAAKKVTSIAALVLNCAMMGVILPKINQAITRKKLKEQNVPIEMEPKFPSFSEFARGAIAPKANNNITFGNLLSNVVYNINNNNTFRLVATDFPMIAGRVATSRNKYEGLENLLIDGGSIYFYNFCANNVQNLLRKASKIPNIDPKIAEFIAGQDESLLKGAFSQLEQNKTSIKEMFNSDVAKEVYKEATHGKFGKINAFVKNQDLKDVDSSVAKFLTYIKETVAKSGESLLVDGKINKNALNKTLKKINASNATYLASGLLLSIIGLSFIVPKTTFWITKKITGRDEFTGIADYSSENKSNKS
ncbi:MAG: hypothetical protein IJD57_01225 [Candidatus Gastranaerophilales bacterium]|nr:hypothetical protein [Candidatus Gastranaerophilales bacterium]